MTAVASDTGERRALQLHHAILKDIVFRQAGSREKAVLEGVTNSVDAGALKIEVSIDKDGLVIQDDGRGFASREEIVANFETFGTPHEEDDAVYGQYRMGRGQLFAFGVNAWRSSTFEMLVDAKADLSYALKEGLGYAKGCRVDVRWYREPSMSDLAGIERGIKEMVRFVSVPVFLNGELISKDPAKERWDVVTKDYFLKVSDRGGVKVYNLGVYVREYPGYQFATGGLAVSRKRLKVNFARNDVQSDCPIWERIKKELRGRAGSKAGEKRQRKLTDDERQAYANMLREGDLDPGKAAKLRLLTDCVGRHWTPQELVRHAVKHGIGSICAEPESGDSRADGLQQRYMAVVLGHETLERFDCRNVTDLVALFQRCGVGLGSLRPAPFRELATDLTGKKVPIPRTAWKPAERALVKVLEAQQGWPLRRWRTEASPRSILIGESDSADAWTDGSETLWLARQFLSRNGWGRTLSGLAGICAAILHEYCHDDSTLDTHVHGAEFFEEYERATHTFLPTLLDVLVTHMPKAFREENRRLGKQVFTVVDRMHKADNGAGHMDRLSELLAKAERAKTEAQELLREDAAK